MADAQDVEHSETKQFNFLLLNPDILSRLITFCSPKTVVALSETCRQLHVICSTELQWKYLFDYHYASCSLPHGVSHKNFLQNHYYHLSPLLGLWVIDIYPYNIVLKISQSYHDPYLFVGLMAALPSSDQISDPVICQHQIAYFSVKDHLHEHSERKNIKFKFSGKFEAGDKLNPLNSFSLTKSDSSRPFDISCSIAAKSIFDLRSRDIYSPRRCHIINKNYQSDRDLKINRIVIKRVATAEPQLLSPGVYRGDYSAHGLELLLVYYEEGEILVIKLAGDENVPAGKISLKCTHANKLQSGDAPAISDPMAEALRFSVIPQSVYPKSFIAIYPGKGQIAYRGFVNPSFCSGMMYVGDEKTFLFRWNAPMNICSLYMRCDELSNECEFI